MGATEKEHLNSLQITLGKLKESRFRLRMDKCKFFQDTVEYLGHVIDSQGIHSHPAKIDAITNMPYPTNIVELHSFLGTYGELLRSFHTWSSYQMCHLK